jgi:hypothetical protein
MPQFQVILLMKDHIHRLYGACLQGKSQRMIHRHLARRRGHRRHRHRLLGCRRKTSYQRRVADSNFLLAMYGLVWFSACQPFFFFAAEDKVFAPAGTKTEQTLCHSRLRHGSLPLVRARYNVYLARMGKVCIWQKSAAGSDTLSEACVRTSVETRLLLVEQISR